MATSRAFFKTIFIFALLSAASALQALAIEPACLQALVSQTWRPTDLRPIETLRRNHLRLTPEGSYEVLVPVTEDSFRIVTVRSAAQASRLLEHIDDPIDIAAAIEAHAAEREHLLSTLAPLVASEPDAVLSGRTKDFESLKAKIFEKVRKRGEAFRLAEIDDIVGARIAAPTRAQVERLAARIRSIEGVEVVKSDPIQYARGYRATHVSIRIGGGPALEVQLMTTRMQAWTLWNAKRIYKPRLSKNTPYFARLQAYDRALVTYVNALDDGVAAPGARPAIGDYGINPDDAFPEEALR